MRGAETLFKEAKEYFEEIAEGNYNEVEREPEKIRICRGMQSFIGAVQVMSEDMDKDFERILNRLKAIEDHLKTL